MFLIRSVSALTVSKEYTASPKKFDKEQADRLARNLSKQASKAGSKKNSVVSTRSDGYHSDDGGRRNRINSNSKKLAGHRMTLMERQNLYARPRSEGNSPSRSPARSRSVSPAKRLDYC